MLLFGWCDLSSVNNDISSVGLLMRRPQGHCPNFGCEELVGSHIGFLNKEENFKDEIQLSVSMFVFSRMLWHDTVLVSTHRNTCEHVKKKHTH